MTSKKTKQQSSKKRTIPMVTLTAYWGNGDASSTFRMPASKWKKVQEGLAYIRNTYGWYEGRRQYVAWKFNGRNNRIGHFRIEGEDGRECIVDCPLSEIIIG